MASPMIYQCIICGRQAKERPPRKCPVCGAPASRWRMLVDHAPTPLPPPAQPAAAAAGAK